MRVEFSKNWVTALSPCAVFSHSLKRSSTPVSDETSESPSADAMRRTELMTLPVAPIRSSHAWRELTARSRNPWIASTPADELVKSAML